MSWDGRRVACLVTTATAALLLTSNAAAATQIGETFVPAVTGGGPVTAIQVTSPGNQYAVSFAGVITSWSFEAGAGAPQPVKLRVAKPAGGNSLTTVADSGLETPAAGQLNSFATRISVQPGDLIGLHLPNGATYTRSAPMTYGSYLRSGDPTPGTTATYTPNNGLQLDVSASLEPDADNDGFGDETQDQCPTDATTQADCAPPDTQITKGPKDKSKKRTATFEFSSSEPGSTFECSLDGGAFAPCSSPDTVKVKKGKHSFAVHATDPAGNVDASPASDDWKVKKKKGK
jgi:hypothetical protein